MSDALALRIRDRIHREGPLPFDVYVDMALYDPDDGFFAHGGAGRAGRDFVTSPEIGSLFGTLVAAALDGWWRELGEPDPFVVVEVGAGRGALARDVLRAAPACAPALRYVLVEQSEALRAEQRTLLALDDPASALGPGMIDAEIDDDAVVPAPGMGPIVTALDALPAVHFSGVVLANELLDNLPFEIVEARADGWHEVRVGTDGDAFVPVLVPLGARIAEPMFQTLPEATSVPAGTRLPVATALRSFVADVAARLRRGVLACIDYAEPVEELVAREGGWLRTFRAHAPGRDPLVAPGTQDITIDVPLEVFEAAAHASGFTDVSSERQADWLRALGLDALADEAAAYWRDHAAVGDLAALTARSRVHEADALTDVTGLGAFRVLVAHKR